MPEFQASIPRHARVRLDPPGQKQEEYTFRCSHRRQRPHLQFLAGLETPCWSRVRDPTYRCNPDRSSASLAVCIGCKNPRMESVKIRRDSRGNFLAAQANNSLRFIIYFRLEACSVFWGDQ